jgi:hypothetical protein
MADALGKPIVVVGRRSTSAHFSRLSGARSIEIAVEG